MVMTSSSSTPPQVKYDVFLSFRGKDTRNNFTSHLYAALYRKRIDTFIDDKIDRGDEISSSLLSTIKASSISIIIFSKNYAESRWCLQELQQILKCKEMYGQIVIPVFYHVDPSRIRKQTGTFGKAFAKLQERFKERLDELKGWQSALEKAGELSGWTIKDETPENVLIEKIVGDISGRLNKLYQPRDNKNFVGVKSGVQKIESLLSSGSNDFRIIGIWGIGGIGKTTISRAVFNKISNQFESHYFAENVREVSNKSSDMSSLKKELFSKLLEDRDIDIESLDAEKKLGHKKVLIVFDDVTSLDQIQNLIEDLSLLDSRSRIIITSRDTQVLKNCGVEASNIYEVTGLHDHDALQLFSKYAFKKKYPIDNFVELSKKIVKYTKGVPLALKVLGSCLFGKTKQEWESEMDKLEKNPHQDIFKVLKISYDGLDDQEKSIFLDIACFFKGWDRSLVQDILNTIDCSVTIGISRLIDKSLLTISYKRTIISYEETITMHDLLQEMGRAIVRQESIDPSKRSRLWHYEDIYNVFRRNTGTEIIQGISLDMHEIISEITLNSHAFANMHNLRFFNLYNSDFEKYSNQDKLHGFEDLEESFSTKIFRWRRCPLKSLPLKFDPENLFRLEMPQSKVKKLWDGVQNLVNLKYIDLGGCIHLAEIPNLSKALNLQHLILDYCESLLEINSSSIENLNKLVKLDLGFCTKLISLPDFIKSKSIILHCCSKLKMAPKISCKVENLDLSGTTIKESPFIKDESRLISLNLTIFPWLERLSSDICKCKYLQYFFIHHYSLLEQVLDDLGNLEALETLEIDGSKRMVGLEELAYFEFSSSFLSRGGDQELMLYRILNALSTLRSLKQLKITSCQVTKLPNNLGQLSYLQDLVLSRNDFESIPSSIKYLSNLRFLDISRCKRVRSLPELPRGIDLEAYNCSSLESISDLSFLFSPDRRPQMVSFANCLKLNLLTILYEETCREFCDWIFYPGSEIPKWFNIQKRGSYVTLAEPPDWRIKTL